MLKSKLIVSKHEKALLDAIRSLGYGEMYSLDVQDGLYDVPETVTPAESDLLDFIREGHPHIDVLTVHQGGPSYAECDFRLNTFRCRKKVKFPTIPMEG